MRRYLGLATFVGVLLASSHLNSTGQPGLHEPLTILAGQESSLPRSIMALSDNHALPSLLEPKAGAGERTAVSLSPDSQTPPEPLQFVPVTPCRVADTRNPDGPFGGPELTANTSREFDIPQSECSIPVNAVAYSLNVTVVPNASLGYLTLWPAGETQPIVSTLNSDGRVKANAAIIPAGTNGGVSIFVSDPTQVILDIDGYFVAAGTASALAFHPLTPCRIADTRNSDGPLGGPYLSSGTSRSFPIQSSSCSIPSTAQAYSLNLTAVPHSTLNYLTTWPTGESQPVVSTLNSLTGAVTANAAIVPAGTGGAVSIFVSDNADIILDINGYFAPPSANGLSLYSLSPCRVIDTRSEAGAFDGVLPVNAESSSCAPPSTAQAYVLNATVVPSGSLDYLTLWPEGESQPIVSTLNAVDGAVTSNMAIVPTQNGSIDAFSSNSTNLVLDISSYFAPTPPATSTPTFSVPAGTYNVEQTVSIIDSTQDATIYYTTDGTTPTTSSAQYTGPISVSSSGILRAVALAPGYMLSAVASATYTLQAATPILSLPSGTYSGTQIVTIFDATPEAAIYYTTNGTTPTASSTQYAGPISFSSSETVKAIATASGYSQSALAIAAYTIAPAVATPVISLVSGVYSGPQIVTIIDTTPGAVIYYTANGTPPTTSSAKYSGPISVSSSETVEVIATAAGYAQSAVATAAYSITSGTIPEIVTIAGDGSFAYGGDGGIATAASFNGLSGTAVDASGNLYIADAYNNRIRKVAAGTFVITTVAGNGTLGLSGDGAAATSAELAYPYGVAVDSAGNIYIADSGNQRIRKVTASTGIITTIAGGGTTYSPTYGDGGPATSALLYDPVGVALDAAGNVYIADISEDRVRKVTVATGIITTVAGSSYGFSGDGGPAASAGLDFPTGLALDGAGDIYIADGSRIREVFASSGDIFTIAGNGAYGFSGDGGPATSAAIDLGYPDGVAVDSAGNLYIADGGNNRIRKLAADTGIISTVAGNELYGYSGDGGPAIDAELDYPTSISVDKNGNLYIYDAGNSVIREVSTAPPLLAHYTPAPVFSILPGTYFVSQTVAFIEALSGATVYYTTDGSTPTASSTPYAGPITVAESQIINAIAFSPGYQPSSVARGVYSITAVSSPEILTVAGDGILGYQGDGGAATAAELHQPQGVALDSAGNIYIADFVNNLVRKVAASTGIITTVAGNGTYGFSGDGGRATSAELNQPYGVAADAAGNIYIADSGNSRIREVSASTGIITTVAGNGLYGSSVDGGLATNASLSTPFGVAVDSVGNIYIADTNSCKIRKVTASTGIITNVAGIAFSCSYSGDGGPATSATLNYPYAVAVNSSGNIYIADTNNERIREVNAGTGIISTVAGNGTIGNGGDGGPATSSPLNQPEGVAVDNSGNIYFADPNDPRLREVEASNGIITTIAGTGVNGYTGDEGPAIAAELSEPSGVAVDSAGDVFVADYGNGVVREISMTPHVWGRYTPLPYFVLGGGLYDGPQEIVIDYARLPSSVIYYTKDGSTPTASSTVFTSPVTITQSTTFKAIAVAPGYSPSDVVTAVYTIQPSAAATPAFSLESGVYTSTQLLTITDTTSGATIYYTTNGSTPTTSSTRYTGAIAVSAAETVQAIAVAPGYSTSTAAIGVYAF
jgi:sugar lactone lactonase YvrE